MHAARLMSLVAGCYLFFTIAVVGQVAGFAFAGTTTTSHGKTVKAYVGLGAATSDVITITSENFADTVKQGTWFVKFYTDWCKYCQRLQPTWEELATGLKGKVNVGQVNCDREKALCNRFHVKVYPTLVHVHNRKGRVYKNSRELEALVAFAERGYITAKAYSSLRSPFGLLENFKAALLKLSMQAKDSFVEQMEMGTPMWMLCLAVVIGLVSITVIAALILVGAKPIKQD